MSVRRKVLRAFLVISLLVPLIACAVLGWLLLGNRSAAAAYAKRVDEIRAKGQVVDAVGMQKLHAEKASTEHEAEWHAIFEEFSTLEFIEPSLELPYLAPTDLIDPHVPPRGEEWEGEANAKKFLAERVALREKLRKLAIQGQTVFFPIETTGEDIPECSAHQPFQTAVNLLALDAMMAMRFNANAMAIEDVRALIGLSKLLRGEPSVMSVFVNGAADEAVLEIVQTGVEKHMFNEAQLKELLTLVASVQVSREHYALSIEGNRGILLSNLDGFAKKQGFLHSLLGNPNARLVALDLLDQLQAIAIDDIDASAAAVERVELEINRFNSTLGMLTSADHLAPMNIVGTKAMATSLINRQMQMRLAQVAIGVELYRIKHKRLPEALDALTEMGIDLQKLKPVGNKPYGYRLSEDKANAELWGFSLPARVDETPDEPPEVLSPGDSDRRCVWHL